MRVLRRIGQALAGAFDLHDLFAFGGLALVGYGVYQVHVPSAWITVGAVLFWLGVRGAKG